MSGGSPEIRPQPLAGEALSEELLAAEGRARELFPTGVLEGEPQGKVGGDDVARLDAGAFGASGDGAAARLERILAGEGLLVSTGQQPLLFLGPLYVLYKVLSALELARRLEATTGRPALALFWVASDDHDWDEVGRTALIDTENRLHELRLDPPEGWARRPAGAAPLPPEVSNLLDEVAQLIPKTDFVDLYLNLFRDTWQPGRPLGQAFASSLADLLGERPLVWLDAAAPSLKAAAVPLFAAALRNAEAGRRALEAGAARIRELGLQPPIPTLEDATNVFFDSGTERGRLYREGDRVRAGNGEPVWSLEEALAELDAGPERFGPNVALRPVLESWLLPVGATVLGPGELAYWSQLPDLFALHGVRMPAVRPRHAWLLVEGKVRKVLDKLGEEPEAFADGGDEVARRAVQDARPLQVEAALQRLRGALGGALEDVEEAIAAHLPGIRSAVGKARSQAFRAAAELEDQVDARLRERRDVVLEQIRKAALHLYPEGRPQERRQSPLYYLARYGPDLIPAIEARSREVSPPLWPDP